MKILLVEDDPVNRGYLVDALRKDGFYVCDCSDAVRALEVLRGGKGKPDLIITDLVLPGMSGQTMLRHKEVSGIPVMVMTASVDPKSLPPDIEFLPKPFRVEEFLGRVRYRREELLNKGGQP